jgi:hypothetical protein
VADPDARDVGEEIAGLGHEGAETKR